jgi:hypothetical protein
MISLGWLLTYIYKFPIVETKNTQLILPPGHQIGDIIDDIMKEFDF